MMMKDRLLNKVARPFKGRALRKNISFKNTCRLAAVVLLTCLFTACGGDDPEPVTEPTHPSTLETPSGPTVLKPEDIANYEKFYKPDELSSNDFLRSDANWSFARHKQSDHFFVFWEPGFGTDPNAATVPEALRVDVTHLLDKAEQFYTTNIETLKFATTGQGKSNLDTYKMQFYLKYQTEWLATGSGYSYKIGALWVNPSTCHPVGATIAHEIGHTFQYQVYCDQLANGAAHDLKHGFQYGYGADGSGGNGFWEQCAQWQSFQDYPSEAFNYNVDAWKKNYHRHFHHEWMRYASYWLQYYWTQKHGIDALARVWRESQYPEDGLSTYLRLFCEGNTVKFYDELYDYATRMVTYDIDAVRTLATDNAKSYAATRMYDGGEGWLQIGYASCPGTTGFNIIPLEVTAAGASRTVNVTFEGLTPGSLLAKTDPGKRVDSDGNTVSTTSRYNTQTNQTAGWRYGFVALVNGNPVYAPMNTAAASEPSEAAWDVPTGATKTWLVVLGTPDTYNPHPWNDKEEDDEQWPYRIKLTGAGRQ